MCGLSWLDQFHVLKFVLALMVLGCAHQTTNTP
jgi:hypothetical protein